MTIKQSAEQTMNRQANVAMDVADNTTRLWCNMLGATSDLSRSLLERSINASGFLVRGNYQTFNALLNTSFAIMHTSLSTWQSYMYDIGTAGIERLQSEPSKEPVKDLSPAIRFYFRGPQDMLNLAVENLEHFVQLACQVDDVTWMYHLMRGDYSHWFRTTIQDEELAEEARKIEKTAEPGESRAQVLDAIKRRYMIEA